MSQCKSEMVVRILTAGLCETPDHLAFDDDPMTLYCILEKGHVGEHGTSKLHWHERTKSCHEKGVRDHA